MQKQQPAGKMPEYKLKYFAVRARGEITRLLLTLRKAPFKDERLTFEEWGKQKANTTFGQLPILCIDGKEYTESGAIERFLAREFGLYGSTNQEGYEIDQVLGICGDLFEKYVKYFFAKDPKEKEDLKNEFDTKTMPRYLGNIEKLLTDKRSNGYCIGNKLSLGDLAIFNIVDGRLGDAELKDYPKVKAVVNNVKANPEIKAYLEKRPKTDV